MDTARFLAYAVLTAHAHLLSGLKAADAAHAALEEAELIRGATWYEAMLHALGGYHAVHTAVVDRLHTK